MPLLGSKNTRVVVHSKNLPENVAIFLEGTSESRKNRHGSVAGPLPERNPFLRYIDGKQTTRPPRSWLLG
jgi:hypothetical protein